MSEVGARQRRLVKRLDAMDAEESLAIVEEIASSVVEGRSLVAVAGGMGLSLRRLSGWLFDEGHPERLKAFYDTQRIMASVYASEVVGIADNDAEGSNSRRDALRISTRFRLAEAWDRGRYGPAPSGKVDIHVGGNSLIAILSGMNGMENGMDARPEPRVIESAPAQEGASTVTLSGDPPHGGVLGPAQAAPLEGDEGELV